MKTHKLLKFMYQRIAAQDQQPSPRQNSYKDIPQLIKTAKIKKIVERQIYAKWHLMMKQSATTHKISKAEGKSVLFFSSLELLEAERKS